MQMGTCLAVPPHLSVSEVITKRPLRPMYSKPIAELACRQVRKKMAWASCEASCSTQNTLSWLAEGEHGILA